MSYKKYVLQKIPELISSGTLYVLVKRNIIRMTIAHVNWMQNLIVLKSKNGSMYTVSMHDYKRRWSSNANDLKDISRKDKYGRNKRKGPCRRDNV